MADINVKKQGGLEPKGSQPQEGLTRRGTQRPSLFWPGSLGLWSGSPFEMLHRLSEEMDRAFQGMWRGGAGGEAWGWAPAIETFERGNEMVVRAELPGVSQQDVNVELTDDGLVIEGERRRTHEEKAEGFYRTEMSYGRFHREILLPPEVSPEQARAEFRDGVLEVHLPIDASRRSRRKIPIESESAKTGTAQAGTSQPARTTGGGEVVAGTSTEKTRG